MTASPYALGHQTEEVIAYVAHISRYPMLSKEEEVGLARKWRYGQEVKARDLLVQSYLRLVPKIAIKYRNYGVPVMDLIGAGNEGLLKTADRFDPERGLRFSTYAQWWIKSEIQAYMLANAERLSGGMNIHYKRLFFSLRRLRRDLGSPEGFLTDAQTETIAQKLEIEAKSVREILQRLDSPILSLNMPMGENGDTFQDVIIADDPSAEDILVETDTRRRRSKALHTCIAKFSPREQEIIRKRHLSENPETLESLAQRHGVSKERIRQIETRILDELSARVHRTLRSWSTANRMRGMDVVVAQ
jgi:RNA polymerase sigma-32 factor